MELKKTKIFCKRPFWDTLYSELGRRGNNKTESGAFLLGSENSAEITACLYYDDLEPGCLDAGYVHITSKAFIQLWDYCHEHQLHVKADIHTHPGFSTAQSSIDLENPMIKVPGHFGLIVPHFAIPPVCDLDNLGVHEFLGKGFKWKRWKYADNIFQIIN